MNKVVSVICLLGCLSFWLSGCASSDKSRDVKVSENLPQLSCIAVLPTSIPVFDDQVSKSEKKTLEDGAAFLDTVLLKELGGNSQFKVMTDMQLAAMVSDSWAGDIQQVQAISQASRCDGVLQVTLSRYRQRVGTTMSATTSAAAAFSMELVGVKKGRVLWSASFHEKQQALTENIFSFKKAESRNFQWITVEELVQDGMKSRLGHFPYFLSTE